PSLEYGRVRPRWSSLRAGKWSWHESVSWVPPSWSQIVWSTNSFKVTPRKSLDSQRRDHVVFGHLPKTWGNLLLRELTSKLIDDYMSARLPTRNRLLCHRVERVGHSQIDVSVCDSVGMGEQQPTYGPLAQGEGRLRWLTLEEESRLL